MSSTSKLKVLSSPMESSCALGLTSRNLVFSPFVEKLYPPVCSTVPLVCKLVPVGRAIAIRAKEEQKGRVIFITIIFLSAAYYLTNSIESVPTYKGLALLLRK